MSAGTLAIKAYALSPTGPAVVDRRYSRVASGSTHTWDPWQDA